MLKMSAKERKKRKEDEQRRREKKNEDEFKRKKNEHKEGSLRKSIDKEVEKYTENNSQKLLIFWR